MLNVDKVITIEGNHHNVCAKNGSVYIDGEPYKEDGSEVIKAYEVVKIVVNGDVGNIDGTNIEVNGNVSGSIDGTGIEVTGSVGGSIDATVVTIGGSVNGNINATFVSGVRKTK